MSIHTHFPRSDERVISLGDTSVGILPDICLVSHFQVGAWPILYWAEETNNVKRWGLPLMIPNFGRLQNDLFAEKGTTLPTHGFGRTLPWPVVEHSEHSITLQLESSEATLTSYPYDFSFKVHIAVGEGTLTYTLTMENRGEETMPIAPGFHPYFNVAQQDKAALVVNGLDGFDAKKVAWDTQPPDTHYPFPHQVTVEIPRQGTLTIAEQPVNGDYTLADMQVWSEPASAADHNFVCFEPIVTYADGLNRPNDRLNIPSGQSRQIVLQLRAQAQ
jgi:galactose mutarotase-like enzyme